MAEGSAGRSYPLSVVISAVDKITGPMRRITGSLSGAGSALQRINERSGLPILTSAIKGSGEAALGLGKRIGSVIGLVTKAAAAIGLSAAGITAFAQSYADATGAIGDIAEQTGISRERFQELAYAAQLSGSSAEELSGALKKMGLTLGNLRGGSKELKKMFDGLQISLKNTNGTTKTTDELFDVITNRISRIKDPALQAKAAVTIFGESATKLLPLLRGGNKGISEMAAEARRLGVVLSEEAVQDGEAFGDVLDKLKFALRGATNTIGSALIPTLSRLGTQLTEIFIKYRPQIEAFARQFAENLPRYIDESVKAMRELWASFRPVGQAIVSLAENFATIKGVFYTTGGLIIAYLIPGVYALVASLVTLGTALVATPIGAFLTLIAALAAGAYLVYRNWDNIAGFFTDRFDKVKAAFKTGLIDGIAQLWKQFNPAGLIIDSIASVVKYLTGLDLKALVGRLVGGITGSQKEPEAPPRATENPVARQVSTPLTNPLAGRSPLPIAQTVNRTNPTKVENPAKEIGAIKLANPLQQVSIIKQEVVMSAAPSPTPIRQRALGPDPERRAIPEKGSPVQPVQKSEAKVIVDFRNMPPGAQVKSETRGGADIKTNQGYSMMPMANQ